MYHCHANIYMLSFSWNILRICCYRMNFAGAGLLMVRQFTLNLAVDGTYRLILTVCYKSKTKNRNFFILIRIQIGIWYRRERAAALPLIKQFIVIFFLGLLSIKHVLNFATDVRSFKRRGHLYLHGLYYPPKSIFFSFTKVREKILTKVGHLKQSVVIFFVRISLHLTFDMSFDTDDRTF